MGLQGNPCNENRDPAMRTGVPCNENRVFPVGIDLQGVPCKPYRVWVCSVPQGLTILLYILCLNDIGWKEISDKVHQSVFGGNVSLNLITLNGFSTFSRLDCCDQNDSQYNCNYCGAHVVKNSSCTHFAQKKGVNTYECL